MSIVDQILIGIISAFITAVATASVAYFGFWRQAKAELMKEYQTRFNEKKWGIYLDFIALIPELGQINALTALLKYNNLAGNVIPTIEPIQKLYALNVHYHDSMSQIENKILLIGSSGVVKTLQEWLLLTKVDYEVKSEESVNALIKLINLMRVDLGMEKSTLNTKILDGSYYFSAETLKSMMSDFENIKDKQGGQEKADPHYS